MKTRCFLDVFMAVLSEEKLTKLMIHFILSKATKSMKFCTRKRIKKN